MLKEIERRAGILKPMREKEGLFKKAHHPNTNPENQYL